MSLRLPSMNPGFRPKPKKPGQRPGGSVPASGGTSRTPTPSLIKPPSSTLPTASPPNIPSVTSAMPPPTSAPASAGSFSTTAATTEPTIPPTSLTEKSKPTQTASVPSSSTLPDLTQSSSQASNVSLPSTPHMHNVSPPVNPTRQASIPPSPRNTTSRLSPPRSRSSSIAPKAPPRGPLLVAAAAAGSGPVPRPVGIVKGVPPLVNNTTAARPPSRNGRPFGLPPSVSSSNTSNVPTSSTIPGMPPRVIAISTEAGPSSHPGSPSHSDPPPNVGTLAAALIQSIVPIPGSTPPPKPVKKPRGRPKGWTKAGAEEAKAAAAAEKEANRLAAIEAAASNAQSRPSKRRRIDKPRDRTAGRTRAAADEGNEEDELAEDADQEGDDSSAVGTTKKKGKRGTTREKRPDPYKRRVYALSHPELDGVQADDFVGEDIDPATMTMAQLATSLVSEGRVSARALRLHHFKREEEERKRVERAAVVEGLWRRKQIQRRKYRATKNRERAERRLAAIENGDDPAEVSFDSEDSLETFEIDPDRLTPPTSPLQRNGRRSALPNTQTRENEERHSEREGSARDLDDTEDVPQAPTPLFMPNLSDEELPPLPPAGDSNPQGEAEDEDDDNDPRFAGLDTLRFSEGPENDILQYDDDGNPIHMGPDLDRYREEQEERRRRIMEGDDGRVVEIIDAETTFINANSFSKSNRGERWSTLETEFFYLVLGEVGENYTLMKAYFPGRTVQQLKRKGKKENHVNPERVTAAILRRQPIDKLYLSKSAGFDLNRPFDREQELMEEAKKDAEIAKAITNGTAVFDADGRAIVGGAPNAEAEIRDDGAEFERAWQDEEGGNGKGGDDDNEKGDGGEEQPGNEL